MIVELIINGSPRSFDGDPKMPLLWYLRDVLGLTGTKFGCGKDDCGVCMVHVGDEAKRSCDIKMGDFGEGEELSGGEITTIEGLSDRLGRRVQQAWIDVDVPQCGYCQSGQIMRAVALLKRNKNPDPHAINTAMDSVLCRCGTYQAIRTAIKTAAEEEVRGE